MSEKPPKNLTGKTKDGVRPNNRVPYKKATNRQIHEIIDFVADMLARTWTKTQIHRAVAAKYKKDWSTTDRIYIPRAKELLTQRAAMTTGEAKEVGINVLLGIIRTGTPSERTRAEQRLSFIFGYNAPTEHRIATPFGQPIEMKDVTEAPQLPKGRLIEILRAIGADTAVMSGNGNGNGHAEVGENGR